MTTPDVKICSRCGRGGARGYALVEGDLCCTNAEACEWRAAKVERAANAGRCVDCVTEGVTTARKPALDKAGEPRPGSRCVTHWRGRKKAISAAAHGHRLEQNFEISAEIYWMLYALQGGKCFGCQHATGKTKRLAVDHDHELALEHGHDPKKGCIRCIRCLLCGQCNQIIGRLGVEALCRLIQVLTDPPARHWLVQPEIMTGEMTAALDLPLPDSDEFWLAAGASE